MSAAPTPTNTGSLRNESKGKDSVGQLTPVGASVWSQSAGDRSSDRSVENHQGDSDQVSSTGVKRAPWAKATQPDSEPSDQAPPPEVSSTRESIKTSSWTVDSDDDSDDGKVSAPLPTFANPAALSQGGVTTSASTIAAPQTAPQQYAHPSSAQAPRYGDRPSAGGGAGGGGPRDGFSSRQWGVSSHDPSRSFSGPDSQQVQSNTIIVHEGGDF